MFLFARKNEITYSAIAGRIVRYGIFVPGKSIPRNRNLQSNYTSDRFNFVKSFKLVAVVAGLAKKNYVYIYNI